MSLLDEDYDVSCMIGEYHTQRKKYGNVIKELNQLIDFNIHVKYLQNFQFYKCLSIYSRSIWSNKKLINVVKGVLMTRHKTMYLHDWPHKPPDFVNKITGNKFVNTRKDNYIITDKSFTSWRFKSYPPNKDYYPLRSIQFYKM